MPWLFTLEGERILGSSAHIIVAQLSYPNHHLRKPSNQQSLGYRAISS